MARPRPRDLLRREPRRHHGDGLLLSRPGPKRRRPAAPSGMRALVASAVAAAFPRGRVDAAGRLLRDPVLPARQKPAIDDGHAVALARVSARIFRFAASELADHRLGAQEHLVHDRAAAGVARGRREGARLPAQSSCSMRSISSSLKPKWWPISWITIWRTTSARSSPVSH